MINNKQRQRQRQRQRQQQRHRQIQRQRQRQQHRQRQQQIQQQRTNKHFSSNIITNYNINKLFNYCDDSLKGENAIYYIGEKCGNSLIQISINSKNNRIYKYSNEWLYLINFYYPNGYYVKLVNTCNSIINKINNNANSVHPCDAANKIININENVISFITSFSTGTAHGYSGLYYTIITYLENYAKVDDEKYKDHKIIIYKNSQMGILNIIEHLANTNIIQKDKLIYLDSNIIYKFNSITFIPNKYHDFQGEKEFMYKISDFVNKYFINNDNEYYQLLNLYKNIDNITILKTSKTYNLTESGVFNNNIVNIFCKKWNLYLYEPNNELITINLLNKIKLLVVSWGTSFFKNLIYVGDDCKNIIVLVLNNSEFYKQYNRLQKDNVLIYKFKNSKITYKIVNNNLDGNIYE